MPQVGDDDLLVRVRAASLNAGDLDYLYLRPPMARLATGLRTPKSGGLGRDLGGEVESAGKDVTTLKAGDEVSADMTLELPHSSTPATT